MTDNNKQEDDSAVRDLLFLLPTVVDRDEDVSEWTRKEVDKFTDLIFKAGEEISTDQTPVNSPAGKYKKKKYDLLKDYLNQAATEYTDANGKHLVAQACEWVLWELGWLEKETEDVEGQKICDQLSNDIQNRITSFLSGKRKKNKPFYRILLSCFELNRNHIEHGDAQAVIDLVEKQKIYENIDDKPGLKPQRDLIKNYMNRYNKC